MQTGDVQHLLLKVSVQIADEPSPQVITDLSLKKGDIAPTNRTLLLGLVAAGIALCPLFDILAFSLRRHLADLVTCVSCGCSREVYLPSSEGLRTTVVIWFIPSKHCA